MMTVLRFKSKDLEEATHLKNKEIIDILTELGFPTEEDEGEIVVEVTPDRPDMFFFEGVVRAVKRYVDANPKRYVFNKKKAIIYDITKKLVKQRPFIAAALVKNVEITENQLKYLMNAQEKMHETIGRKRKKIAIGIHDAKTIELPIEYIEADEADNMVFIPLGHDKEMKLNEILKKHEKGKKYAHLVNIPKYPIVKDKKGVISLPPIINAERTRLTPGKHDILIEVTGTHKQTVQSVMYMIASVFFDLGGEITILDTEASNGKSYESNKQSKSMYEGFYDRKRKIDDEFISFLHKITGLELTAKQIENLLKKMDYYIKNNEIIIPPYRIDINKDIDIIEDVLIAYGYNNIEPELPTLFSEGKKNEFMDKLHDLMKSMEFLETKSNILTDKDYLNQIGMESKIDIKNPANREFNTIRPSIIPSIIRSNFVSRMRKKPIKFYEIDHIYKDNKDKIALAFSVYDENININTIKSYFQTLQKELNIKLELRQSKYEYFDEQQQADIIKLENKGKEIIIGKMGLISKKIQTNILKDEKTNLVICEIEDINNIR